MKIPSSIYALALGPLTLGISEFVMMGILTSVSESLGVSYSQAGHCITAYALGVCFGAILLPFAHRFLLKNILIALSGIMFVGAALSISSVSYEMLLAARFISGVPHGAYFGVATLVATRLAPEGKQAFCVSLVCAGMSIANLVCVPLGTMLSNLSWRIPFCLSLTSSLLAVWCVWKFVPDIGTVQAARFKSQFNFLKKTAPWLVIMMTMMGNCGIFCWYSYVDPTFVKDAGFAASSLPYIMILTGMGMVIGNLVGGKLSDKYNPGKVVMTCQLSAVALLILIAIYSTNAYLLSALAFLIAFALFAVGGPQQLLIIRHSKGGELLGGAAIQIAFNFGNAIGSFCGGLPIDAGHHVGASAWVGVPIVLLGVLASAMFIRVEKKSL
ncbi:MAG: MFS transporter [Bacteroidales bacterium]|nr:MFS transporter [Bacteroidales bacterium]